MVKQITEDIFCIQVPLPGNPLRETNAYLVRGKESNLLIDTGFRNDVCRQALREGFEELGCRTENTDVFVTHLHSDHSGLCQEFAGADRNIYMGKTDTHVVKERCRKGRYELDIDRFREEGFPEEALRDIYGTNPAARWLFQSFDERFREVSEGDCIRMEKHCFTVIDVPGHTPGNLMLWDEENRIMFTGDHILFTISPNITFWRECEDALGDYLDGLKRVRKYPVETALPGHRESGNYQERIDRLLEHHDRRLNSMLEIIAETPGLNATEISARMKWKIRAASWEEFPINQKWFAVAECISHLDYLQKRGLICSQVSDQIRRYYPTDN